MQLFSRIQTAKIQLFSNLSDCIMQLFSDRAVFLWETMYQILYESYRLQFAIIFSRRLRRPTQTLFLRKPASLTEKTTVSPS